MKLASRIFKRDDWYVTSKFGYRDVIHTSAGSTDNFHNGCDYGTNSEKWKQYAIEDGKVLSAGKDSLGGKYAWVEYPRLGFKLLYYHLILTIWQLFYYDKYTYKLFFHTPLLTVILIYIPGYF